MERDPEYDLIPKLPERPAPKKGSQCGECGMKFEYGVAYGYCCMNPRCPTNFRSFS
jgi:hypothetical protein